MKKFYLLTFMAIPLSLSCLAQPILNRDDIEPSIGESFTVTGFDWDGTLPSLGANQTWDYSGVNLTASAAINYIDPTTATEGSSFPTATVASDYQGATFHEFEKYTNAAWERVGVHLNGKTVPYFDAQKLMEFPFSYGDNFTDSFKSDFFSGAEFKRRGEVSVDAVGYGTVILPGATLTDVLCVKIVEDYGDWYQGTQMFQYDTEIYMFFKAGIHLPVLTFTMLDYSGSKTSYASLQNNIPSAVIEHESKVFSIYPNPATDVLYINFPSNRGGEKLVEIYSMTGAQVYQSQNITNKISLADFEQGVYFVHLRSGEHVEVKKFVKE